MTATFLLPLAMGACEAMGGNMLTDAFGIVAMVAMTPLIIIQLIGLGIPGQDRTDCRGGKAAPAPQDRRNGGRDHFAGVRRTCIAMTSLCGLITIVDRGKSAAVQRIYQAHQVHSQPGAAGARHSEQRDHGYAGAG